MSSLIPRYSTLKENFVSCTFRKALKLPKYFAEISSVCPNKRWGQTKENKLKHFKNL